MAQELGWLSTRRRVTCRPGLSGNCSGSSSVFPLPFSRRNCRCGRPLDAIGHHRAACSRAGILGRRGFAPESAAARIRREAGARVTTNVFVRDLDMGVPSALDGRRLEVVADGLPLHGGAQLATDTTMVSPLHADGTLTGWQPQLMVRFASMPGDARSGRTLNSFSDWCDGLPEISDLILENSRDGISKLESQLQD